MANQTEPIRHVNYRKNLSLAELHFVPGELVAFDNPDLESPSSFVLAIPDRLVDLSKSNGHVSQNYGFKLLFNPLGGEKEEWMLYTTSALGLWAPRDGVRGKVPSIDNLKQGLDNPYFIEDMYSGKEAIQKALARTQGFAFYADCLKNGTLITERGIVGQLAKKLGLSAVLPPQIRFKHYRA